MSTKTSKLTQSEKYQIQGMLHNRIPLEEIASSLSRTEKQIRSYIDGELDGILDTVTKVNIEQAEARAIAGTPKAVVDKAIKTLVERGIKSEDAAELVRRACLAYTEKPFTGSGSLVHVALQQINSKDLMLTKTAGKGRKGSVAVMTKEASERMDERRKNIRKRNTGSRVTRGNIYLIKEDRII